MSRKTFTLEVAIKTIEKAYSEKIVERSMKIQPTHPRFFKPTQSLQNTHPFIFKKKPK